MERCYKHVKATCLQGQCGCKRAGEFCGPRGDWALHSLEMFWRSERLPLLFPHVAALDHARN